MDRPRTSLVYDRRVAEAMSGRVTLEEGGMDVEVVHEPQRRRFVVTAEGKESQLFYIPLGDSSVDFRSTFVHPALRGRGVGEKLVLRALDWARDEGLKVVPTCWYVDTVVRRHPEYAPLIQR